MDRGPDPGAYIEQLMCIFARCRVAEVEGPQCYLRKVWSPTYAILSRLYVLPRFMRFRRAFTKRLHAFGVPKVEAVWQQRSPESLKYNVLSQKASFLSQKLKKYYVLSQKMTNTALLLWNFANVCFPKAFVGFFWGPRKAVDQLLPPWQGAIFSFSTRPLVGSLWWRSNSKCHSSPRSIAIVSMHCSTFTQFIPSHPNTASSLFAEW